MISSAVSQAQASQDDYLGQLVEFLRIPSVSTQPEHAPDIRRAAEWLLAEMDRIGLELGQIIETNGHPVVYGDWLGADEDAPTVLVYGHYDVQPAEPLDLWESPPFEPTIRNDAVYARGASDNKAQMFSHLKAVESMLTANGRLPLNVKFCFDGEEELGSPNLESFVHANRDLLTADSILVSDGAMVSSDQPTIDYALRGVVAAEIRVNGPDRDLHSGSYGGSVHNPIQALAEILASLHDEFGWVKIPGFYDRVASMTTAERALLRQVSYTVEQWQTETGAPQPWGEPDYSLIERMTARPTCDINGVWGGYQGEGTTRTIIPAEAGAKITMRLVENQDAEEIAELLTAYVLNQAPDTVKVSVEIEAGADPAVTPFDSSEIAAAARAYTLAWGAEPVRSRGGGSLPIMALLQSQLDAPFVLMPFGLDDNRHSANEHYLLEHFSKGINTAIHYYHYLAEL